jgi:hypothetical protein
MLISAAPILARLEALCAAPRTYVLSERFAADFSFSLLRHLMSPRDFRPCRRRYFHFARQARYGAAMFSPPIFRRRRHTRRQQTLPLRLHDSLPPLRHFVCRSFLCDHFFDLRLHAARPSFRRHCQLQAALRGFLFYEASLLHL